MAAYIEMPKLSDTMTEGTLLKWLVNEGDSVESGDILAEIETDKATMEMECFEDGIVYRHVIPAGSKAPIGATVAVIIEEGEDPPSDEEIAAGGSGSDSASSDDATDAPATSDAGSESSAPASAPAAASAEPVATVAADGSRIKASPLAKKVAKQRGVNLAGVILRAQSSAQVTR